jgi:uncharacterized membrane protein
MSSSPSEYISPFSSDRRPLAMWIFASTIAMVVMGMIVGAPVALMRGHAVAALSIYAAFSHLCHQIPERSFLIGGYQFAVCARCTGLYAGFSLATCCYPLLRSLRRVDAPPRKWLFIAATPLAVDFALGYLGIWENTHLSRFLTGTLLGAAAVFYVMPGLIDLSLTDWRRAFDRKRSENPVKGVVGQTPESLE